ncbi:MAG: acylhydrolase [Bacteroidales bacterium]|nr:acylhydrolase [Bacteroidales bacterium]
MKGFSIWKMAVATVLAALCLQGTAVAQKNVDPLEKDWANFRRYAEKNARVKTRPVAVLMGDSITQNWAKFDTPWLDEHNILGRGISGQTSAEMLVRFRADVIDLKPEYVHILAGINDIACNNGRIKVVNVFKNIVSMVELAKYNGIKPIVCTTTPAKEFGWRKGFPDPRPSIDSLNTMITAYAIANDITLIDYFTALKDDDGGLDKKYQGDAVHPALPGYKVMEALLLEAIEKDKAKAKQ